MAQTITYTVKSVKGETAEYTFDLPSGKKNKFVFKKGADARFPDFVTCELPEKVEYTDDFGHIHTLHTNYTAFFLGAYNDKDKNTNKCLYNKYQAIAKNVKEDVDLTASPVTLDLANVPEVPKMEVKAVEPAPAPVPVSMEQPTAVEEEAPKPDYSEETIPKKGRK